MKKLLIFIYGIVSYAFFLLAFLYAIGFVGNIMVFKSIDSGTPGEFWPSLFIDVILMGIFGLQHSMMARPGFKKRWAKVIPKSMERSTYVLFSSMALIVLYYFWRPLTGIIWHVDSHAGQIILLVIFGLGWVIVLISTFMISHVHLFGLHQVYDKLKGKEQWEPGFQMTGFYRYMRHPIMNGFLIAFWATPHMTVGHLVFAIVTTVYILVATLGFEEKDLKATFGKQYQNYLKQVPAFFPLPNRRCK